MDKNAPIGIFDSGIGGLTVVREIMRQLPEERIVYFGDTARLPYGNKSRETVIRFSEQILRFLRTKEVKAIVIACNTASSYALEELRKAEDIPIIGVINAGARAAVSATKNGRIGVIGTEGTVNSMAYANVLKEMDPSVKVFGKACPLFVPLVEEGLFHDTVTDEIASRYLSVLKEKYIDTLVMGCTHYPLIRSTIARTMGDGVTLVNPAYETAVQLKTLFKSMEISCDPGRELKGEEKYQFYVSDMAEKFSSFATSILPGEVNNTVLIDIEKY